MTLFVVLAMTAATLAAIAIPGQQFGLNVTLVWIVMAIAVWTAVRDGLDDQDSFLFALAIVPVFLAVVRSAGWVVGIQLVAAVCSLSVAAARARGWISIIRAPLSIATRLHRGFALVLRPLTRVRWWDSSGPRTAIRAGGLTLALVAIFGPLFLSADAAFASLAERLLAPDFDIALVPARVAVFIGSLALVGSLAALSPVLLEPSGSQWSLSVEDRYSLKASEWKIALAVLNVLFASFVVVQLTVLFGGHGHVLETAGLTYAEYARQGFFQLIVVAVLTLGVVAVVISLRDLERDRVWIRALLGPLCLMTLVILVSAARRMDLYEEAFGFTRLRLLVDLSIIWLGAVFALILAAGAFWRGSWLPRAVVITSLVLAVGFGVYDPDRRIAERNIARFEATGRIDLPYLSGLSTDALPALGELPDPMRACAVQAIVSRATPTRSFWSFNLSRRTATSFKDEGCEL